MIGKGIAVSQIILLVLGILVLAVVAFLLYSNFVSTGGTLNAETCRAEATRLCTGCQVAKGSVDNNCEFDKFFRDELSVLGRCLEDGNLPFSTDLGDDTGSITCSNYVGG